MPRRKFSNPRERFLGLAETRTNSVLEKLKVLGNCSNRQLYEYSLDEVSKIFRTIEEELQLTKQKFISSTRTRKNKFRL